MEKVIVSLAALVVFAFAVAPVVAVPIGLIWSLNTLFALAIPITFKTVFAALVISCVVRGSIGVGD